MKGLQVSSHWAGWGVMEGVRIKARQLVAENREGSRELCPGAACV